MKAFHKERLHLVDKPLIQYVVNKSINAGIEEIILFTHSSNFFIENHVDINYQL